MASRAVVTSLVSTLAMGAALAVAAPAQAAEPQAAQAKQCALGKWTLVGINAQSTGTNRWYKGSRTGGGGAKLTITKTKSYYNFDKSARIWELDYLKKGHKPNKAYDIYRKNLAIPSSVTGGGKGVFASKTRAATGNATFKSVGVVPPGGGPSGSLVKALFKRGIDVIQVPAKAGFTCTKTRLVWKRSYNWYNPSANLHAKAVETATWRRG
ncbi:hypothetical protein [Actinomadura rupiterrae]|uniref:hypothetical protein n=1 Tax=Actinomadura rupiterrae TaxID=559627 RepID=UPI0020A490EC|nr:hypothetical protein [Actinomadura rupiterrae]MCP2340530.1 hypothetical protein [Actinomadura rupiterrae]